jgi:hypothetical protein
VLSSAHFGHITLVGRVELEAVQITCVLTDPRQDTAGADRCALLRHPKADELSDELRAPDLARKDDQRSADGGIAHGLDSFANVV